MSLHKKLWIAIIVLLLLVFSGSFLVSTVSAKSYLEQQISMKNADNAAALALSLTQQGADDILLELTLSAQFDTGFYELIELRDPEGKLKILRQDEQPIDQAPSWFVTAFEINVDAGIATVQSGWQQVGTLTLRSHSKFAYERLWHWLQASAIMMLLFTGLIIHKPHFFGMFSFPYVVNIHNVLGFVLLINAALALFYNLASGEIRQYLPEPRGFIARSMSQAMYYSQGIFAGKPHPLEKTKEHKLNPLQQITYLAILNVLLPAQVITGVLIWGLQRWPGIAAELGGLPMLALVHTLVAWAFATFIVMHVYLTTTGHKPTAGIKSMVVGWDDVEKVSTDPQNGDLEGESK